MKHIITLAIEAAGIAAFWAIWRRERIRIRVRRRIDQIVHSNHKITAIKRAKTKEVNK